MLAPKLAVQSVIQNINFTETGRFLADQAWFNDVNLVHMQRQVSNHQHDYFTRFIVPLSSQTGMWVVYNVDDAIHMDDIPKYNSAWKAYQSEELMGNIKSMLQATDFLLVTTDYIKDYYVRKFEVDESKVLVIPNYLPKWWMGQYYDLKKSVANYDKYKKRPRIGCIASSTHYDTKNNNGGVDDFTSIIDLIRKTTKKYEWVFMNTVPSQLKDLLDAGKITCERGDNIMNYPDALARLHCQAFVQPLIDNEFNKCKSPIKYLEAAAMGTPLIAQRINVYEPYTDLLFDDADELQSVLNKVLNDKQKFISVVKEQKRELDQGRGGKGWWLENNINDWAVFYRLTKKCITIDVNRVIEAQKSVKENTDHQVEGLEIIR
jgi:glycosyltransferase involved in cell wall biosynthesis